MLKIDILCSDPKHPVNAWLGRWKRDNRHRANIAILRNKSELSSGDMLFLISCHQVICKDIRARYRYALVIHASDLPTGRGWSPVAWQVLEGANDIVVSLLNAEDCVDSGAIWEKRHFVLDGTELHDEINAKLFEVELDLMDWALDNCDSSTPEPQAGEPTFWPKRTPSDSEIDATARLADCFDTIRISDPDRYPAHFTYRGSTYKIRLERM